MTARDYIVGELKRYLESVGQGDKKIILDKPKQKQFGDISSNLAMQLAGVLKKKPRDIAQEILDFITPDEKYIRKTDIAGPGFINFFIAESSFHRHISEILERADSYGRSMTGSGRKVQVEFISANPTGPLTIGHGRQAVLGDTIARLLEHTGHEVTREYYYNNAGRQMRMLGNSVRLRYLQLLGDKSDFPEDHYQGEYITAIARNILKQKGDSLKDSDDLAYFTARAEEEVFADIRQTIARLGFEMDVYYNENSLYEDGYIDEVIAALRSKGLVEDREGAVWFLTSQLGMEQDRVIVKSSGEPTYRLPDIAYHREKFKRGFDQIVDIFGADHIATYPDVLLGLKAMDYDVSRVKVLIHQFVTLTEGSEKIKMSTRKANFVTLDELISEVGKDVTRFFFLMRHMNSHLNFDLTLAKNQSDENPVYYVQYAHARICSILRFAEEKGFSEESVTQLDRLDTEEELSLIKHLADFPPIVESSALNFEPHRLVNYLIDGATLFHKFYTECRVITDDQELSRARLSLCKATRTVFANGCQILGIEAPQKM